VTLGDLSAGQPHPYRAVQPAWAFRQGRQKWLTEEEALPGRRDGPESQFASLISPVQHDPPAKGRPLLPIPVEHPDELLA
jgi:hypothetical protein